MTLTSITVFLEVNFNWSR